MINKLAVCAMLLAATLAIPSRVVSAINERPIDTREEKLIAFLSNSAELQKTVSCRFKEFKSIPETLREKLTQTFASYAFYVARMNVFVDLPVKEYDLILITDANSGAVQAYIWASYFTFPPSASFERILKGRQAKSKTDAVNQLRVLAELIAQPNKDEAGKGIIQRSAVLVELLRGDGVIRILKAEIDKSGRFGRLSIVGADGRKPRYLI